MERQENPSVARVSRGVESEAANGRRAGMAARQRARFGA